MRTLFTLSIIGSLAAVGCSGSSVGNSPDLTSGSAQSSAAVEHVATDAPIGCEKSAVDEGARREQSVGQSMLDQIAKTNVIVEATDLVPLSAYNVTNRGGEVICVRPSTVDVVEQIHINLDSLGERTFAQPLPLPPGPIRVVDINDRAHALLFAPDGETVLVGFQLLSPTYTDRIDEQVALTFVIYRTETGQMVVLDETESETLTDELAMLVDEFGTDDVAELVDRVVAGL